MLKVSVKRTDTEAIVTVKSDNALEKKFEFSLSPKVTSKSLRLILPAMIETERDKRRRKAHRKIELKQAKEERKLRSELDNGEVNEES